jgi:RNA polymerase sigma-70 factor, ECF subfamily
MLVSPQTRRTATGPTQVGPVFSFDAVYRAHARLVGRWAQRLGGPGVEADETVQEVFVTVNRRLPAFTSADKVTSWLFQITARVVANQRRAVRRRRLRWTVLSDRIVDQTMSNAPGPADLLERREATERFYRVLDRLREKHRHVLVLFELEEMTTEQIAVLVARPPATVRVWLHRGRAAFAKFWHDEVKEEDDDGSKKEIP